MADAIEVSSSSAATEAKKIILKSSDNVDFEVDEAVAMQSQTIKHMIEDGCADNAIPLSNVTAEILDLVIEYCEKHVGDGDKSKNSADTYTYTCSSDTSPADELKKWDAEFVKVDQDALFDLMLVPVNVIKDLIFCVQAANYLNIVGLLDLTCQTVADMMKGRTPEEIRTTFNIENDLAPEEEEAIRKEYRWAFE